MAKVETEEIIDIYKVLAHISTIYHSSNFKVDNFLVEWANTREEHFQPIHLCSI